MMMKCWNAFSFFLLHRLLSIPVVDDKNNKYCFANKCLQISPSPLICASNRYNSKSKIKEKEKIAIRDHE